MLPKFAKMSTFFWKNADISSENVNIFPYRREEERIEEDRKGEYADLLATAVFSNSKFQIFGEYSHVKLTAEQYKKLISDFGEDVTDEYIRRCDEYQQQKGKSYKDYNLTIRNWIEKDGGVEAVKAKLNKPKTVPSDKDPYRQIGADDG